MRRLTTVSALACVLLSISACTQTASNSCAAANAPITFGNLLSNSLSSNYGQCLDSMREDLAVARLRARTMEAKAVQLREESSRLRGERARAAARLAEINERHAAALAELNATDSKRVVERRQLDALLADERGLREEIERLNTRGGASEAETANIARRQEQVRKQIRAAVGTN